MPSAPQPQMRVFDPGTRPPPVLPVWAVGLLVGTLALHLILGAFALGRVGWLSAALKVLAVLSSCRIAGWAEERLFVLVARRASRWRLLGGLLSPLLGVSVAVFGVALLREFFVTLGDDGTIALTWLCGGAWFASSAVGSLLILALDRVVSSLVSDFRARITFATLSLVVFVSTVAVGLFSCFPDAAAHVRELRPEAMNAQLQGLILAPTDIRDLLLRENFGELTSFLIGVAVLCGVPAVLSACTKLAEAVMERVHPLTRAFDAVSQGDLNVHVEEGGSRDFVTLSRNFNRMVHALAEKQAMDHAFGLYVSPHVREVIREQAWNGIIPARNREATVFFVDIRGFTSMSEKLEPMQIQAVLNRYFDRMVPIIEFHEGYLDKFVGDAMLVVFNGPIDQHDHAQRAVHCAIALQRELEVLSLAGAFPEVGELQVGIGITTGLVVTGSVGGAGRMEFTVIGDTVNLAARLTGQAAPGEVLVSEATAALLTEDVWRVRLEPMKVKGREVPVLPSRIWPQAAPKVALVA